MSACDWWLGVGFLLLTAAGGFFAADMYAAALSPAATGLYALWMARTEP